MVDSITFPEEEIEYYQAELREGNDLFTVRVGDEYGRFRVGRVYTHPRLGSLKVAEIADVDEPAQIPWWSTIPPVRQKEIEKYGSGGGISWIRLRLA